MLGPRWLPATQVLEATPRESVLGADDAWGLGCQPQPPKGCFGGDGHDLAQVLAVERTVDEGAVLEEANAQHVHRAAVVKADDHLGEAHEAVRVSREPAGAEDEGFDSAARDWVQLPRSRSQKGPDTHAHDHKESLIVPGVATVAAGALAGWDQPFACIAGTCGPG